MHPIADVYWPDLLRGFAMFLAGIYFAAKVPILAAHIRVMAWFRRGRLRHDDVRLPILVRETSAALAVAYIVCDMATRFGAELTWRAPLAIVVCSARLYGLWVTQKRDTDTMRAVRADRDHPERPHFRR